MVSGRESGSASDRLQGSDAACGQGGDAWRTGISHCGSKSFRAALAHLESKGLRATNDEPGRSMRVNTSSVTGYPQIHILDPDRNVIEINAETVD